MIQAAHDAAVIMISAFTQEGADITLAALERGATDFFPKPERHQLTHVRESRDILVGKILSAAQHRPRKPPGRIGPGGRPRSLRPPRSPDPALHPPSLVATDRATASSTRTSSSPRGDRRSAS